MPINAESTPPPLIGKIGPYTVFVTPPATPKPSDPHISASPPPANIASPSPPAKTASPSPPAKTASPLPPAKTASPSPPVQPPPQQFYKPKDVQSPTNGSTFGFFWNAIAKVQNAHSNLDEYVAHWFGLNQSKYQWALDDYYESKGMDQIDAKEKDKPSKVECV